VLWYVGRKLSFRPEDAVSREDIGYPTRQTIMSSRALGTFPCESIGKEQAKRLLVVSRIDK
jgi:hypothetical protein